MKRMRELEKLSHDHHRGLVLARRVRASLSKSETALDVVRPQILAEFEAVLVKHFDLEERFLSPPLRRAGFSGIVDRLLHDHDAIRRLTGLGPAMSADDARTFAALLEEHIRFEERELFEVAQRVLREDERKALMDASTRQ